MITIIAPYDLNLTHGNEIRPVIQGRGLIELGFTDFQVFCLRTNKNLPFNQFEINKGIFSLFPSVLRYSPTEFLYDLPLFSKMRVPEDTTLLHLHNYHSFLIMPASYKGTVIADFHGIKSLELENTLSDKPKPYLNVLRHFILTLIRRIEEQACKHADHIVVASNNLAEELQKNFGIPESKISVIPNCVSLDDYLPNSYVEPFTLGIVGPFIGTNREVISNTIAITTKTQTKIIVVGDILEKDKTLLEKCENVKVMGHVDEEKLKQFYATIGALLLPYFNESRGGGIRNKLLQAAASATPIISTPAGIRGFNLFSDEILIGNTIEELCGRIEFLNNNWKERKVRGIALKKNVYENFRFPDKLSQLIKIYERYLNK